MRDSWRPPASQIAIAISIACSLSACGRDHNSAITAVGTLEVVEVDVAPTVGSRVVRVLVDEGEVVKAGDTVAILTQPTSRADIAGRTASVAASQAVLREAQRGPRTQEIQRARAELLGATADAERTTADLARIRTLAARQIVSQQQLDAVVSAERIAQQRRDAASATVRLLEQGSTVEQIEAAQAQVGTAQAALAASQAVASDLVLTAPVGGVVVSRNTEPGEVLAPTQSVITLGDVTRPWVRVYVNQRVLPFVQVGDTVHGALDGAPTHPFTGRVVAITTRAEFTPRVALTESERADLMFGIKVAFADTTRMLKAGLPITVTFPLAIERMQQHGGHSSR